MVLTVLYEVTIVVPNNHKIVRQKLYLTATVGSVVTSSSLYSTEQPSALI